MRTFAYICGLVVLAILCGLVAFLAVLTWLP